ncbi:MAG: carbohydrate kinase family protein [Phycisphaeraceae bacterium]|nr:carbohydrate kinase family protein [Phycisphaeraceae bacterium]
MTSRLDVQTRAADGLRALEPVLNEHPAVVGFDGFIDSIIRVVDKRHDAERFDPIPSIAGLGQRILGAAGMSCNIELVVTRQKLGGNGPIMAAALAEAGLPTSYVGALGYPEVHPVFADFAKRADCLSIAEAAYTDALEFSDGKLMLGKLQTLGDVNWQRLKQADHDGWLNKTFGRSSLIAMVNWTMLPHMDTIWKHLAGDLLPSLPQPKHGRRKIFIDLADPEKRTRDDLAAALRQCASFQPWADVVLGVNFKESDQVARTLNLTTVASERDTAGLRSLAQRILETLRIAAVVIHPRHGAAGAVTRNGKVDTAWFDGPFIEHPKLSTGAGDNFNAGFCLGLLAELDLEAALCVGTATSGYYVRQAGSPTLRQLTEFCATMPGPVG